MAPDREVMDILEFTQHDLEANLKEKVTPEQRNRIWKQLLPLRVWLYIVPVALGASIITTLAIDAFDLITIAALTLIPVVAVSLVSMLNIVIFLTSRVHSAEGELFLSGIEPAYPSSDADKSINALPYYTLNIGEDYFYITFAVYQVLKPYEREYCTLYYLADPLRRVHPRKEILSLDFVKQKKKQE